MNVLIVGYGRMGREVEKILLERGHRVSARVDALPGQGDSQEVTPDLLKACDGVIEFSLPQGIEKNITAYSQAKVPAVIGTTGWDKDKDRLCEMIKEQGGSLLWGNNFSLGAHLFWRLTEEAARLVKDIEDYDILVHEFHHKMKKDSPSGTALTTAEKILNNCPRKKTIVTQRLDRAIESEELHLSSTRGGSIPGTHQVLLDSQADTIEVKHTARSRQGFALGAVMAAEWLQKKTGVYRVEDFVNDFLG